MRLVAAIVGGGMAVVAFRWPGPSPPTRATSSWLVSTTHNRKRIRRHRSVHQRAIRAIRRATAWRLVCSRLLLAQGSDKLENGPAAVPFYGYDGNGPMVPLAGDVQTETHNVEANKTEPDKNTYLRLDGQHGADPDYDYGTHFLFQGHEGGSPGYITE